MIISDRKIILYMGVPCTREWDYYTTRGANAPAETIADYLNA